MGKLLPTHCGRERIGNGIVYLTCLRWNLQLPIDRHIATISTKPSQ
jgi:hypothetical protein